LKKNLVLTGMMAVGKSTIGRLLSEKVGIKFYDIDKIIENDQSTSINEIFKKHGEEFFRKIELEKSIKYLEEKEAIIALGGGAFLNETIRKNIKINSFSVWLDLKPKFIFQRIKNIRKRPLLNNSNSEKDVEEIYAKRKSIYSLADFKIDCNFKTQDKLLEEVLKVYENI